MGRLRYLAFGVATASLSLVVLLLGLEIGLRLRGTEQSLQPLFTDDPIIGYRPRPRAEMTYTTAEFSTRIRINSIGVRDEEEFGPKRSTEHRVVVLGDSMAMAIQVPMEATFAKRLEQELRREVPGLQYRVIDAGVQGYGTVEEWLFFEKMIDLLEPDVVIVAVTVGNDAVESADAAWRLEPGKTQSPVKETARTGWVWIRRLTRRSEAIQFLRQHLLTIMSPARVAPLRQRPLDSYLEPEPPEVRDGLDVSARCIEKIAALARSRRASTVVALLPSRFQLNDKDYANLQQAMSGPARTFVRDAASERYRAALSSASVAVLDLLPAFRAEPRPADLYFQENVHLTPRGHQVVAEALLRFMREQQVVPAPTGVTGKP